MALRGIFLFTTTPALAFWKFLHFAETEQHNFSNSFGSAYGCINHALILV
jgi:hypothetical protein